MTTQAEATISTSRNSLVLLSPVQTTDVVELFCGRVIHGTDSAASFVGQTVYLAGDLANLDPIRSALEEAARVFVVAELADGTPPDGSTTVTLGQVPLLWHGMGVFYRQFFDPTVNYFDAIDTEHTFQSLTESNKPGVAHRSGLYLTDVEDNDDDLHFRLLRCSTNLSGPTENFGETDRRIVAALNREAEFVFDDFAALNHVLAQIYPNTPATDTQRERKAKIGTHADKTKDMPEDGIMAFCTFYDATHALEPMSDGFDLGVDGTSGMTVLDFRRKEKTSKTERKGTPERFTVTLYPDSVFLMPLSTNRLYTHAIRASHLDAAQLPTRLGYVVRCSNTEAVHRDGKTYLKTAGEPRLLAAATDDGVAELRRLYASENRSSKFIDYADRFDFSMNTGDYERPRI